MNEIKNDLKEIVSNTMIPEVTEYLEDLHKLIEDNKAKDDDMEAIRDLESFLVELENIILAIDENKMNEDEAREIYERILNLIEESQNH